MGNWTHTSTQIVLPQPERESARTPMRARARDRARGEREPGRERGRKHGRERERERETDLTNQESLSVPPPTPQSPQRFHYYFYLSVVSWQYQKYSTIPIPVLRLLRVTPLVCSSYSSFAMSLSFFSSWWQKDCELFTHTLVLQCSPSTSLRQPQTTHVFAVSRIRSLCHALRICVVHAPPESCPFSLLVHWAFRACHRNRLPLMHHAFLTQN